MRKAYMYLRYGNLRYTCLVALSISFACSGPDLPEEVAQHYQELPKELDYNIHIKPILSDKCFACHGPDQANQEAGLRLDLAEAAYGELPETPGKKAIVPGNLKHSEMYHRILSKDEQIKMPPPEFKIELSDYEKAVLVKWIKSGAKYKTHWAFNKPELSKVPKSKFKDFALNPIDHFIAIKLEEQNLLPSPEADKELLLRRLSLDLTGLPPSIQEMDAFLKDESPNAYEKQVDRLLASVHYGEKMAIDWMDLARYADTYGYQVDRYRDMSPWRDWVIQSFNGNRPYDEFIIWQLGGDLLPEATSEQILATGFNRLHPQNMEDGIIGEEYRVENVADRVAVLGDGLLGLTLSCAKCHDHKYDPISQKEYYQLYSFFNNINETGQISWDKGTPVPVLELPNDSQKSAIAELKVQIKLQEQKLKEISEQEKVAIQQWIQNGIGKAIQQLPQKGLIAHYPLDNQLSNRISPKQKVKMDREFSPKEYPNFSQAYQRKGLQLDGDAWLDCSEVGIFKRSDPFSIGLWINIPKNLENGVIFHKNKGSTLHAFRGYHLELKNNKLEWGMARTYPENAIIKESKLEVPKEEWIHLAVTYDGSSTAKGSKLFLNGQEIQTTTIKDNLSRDIVFNYLEDIIYPEPIEPNLQVGARWRGVGIKGAIVDEIMVYNRELSPIELMQISGKIDFPTEEDDLVSYYLSVHSKPYDNELQQLHKFRTALVDSMELVKEVMVMKEMETPRKSFILNRGVYDNYGEEVFPSTPRSVMPMPSDLPKNRLGLAQWLVHPDHPLTARVAVNRYWQNYFGRGLVKTAQDFGNQGELPSHPELLDWLAIQFIESGWDVKALQKLIVMSGTYRQNSYTSPELLAIDKENKWLSRGPSVRLSSEMIRDNALAASGLLNKVVGGESVYPYQPEGLWAMNFDPYPLDSGEKLYRRSIYTMWRRTNPNPTLSTFDQPERNLCTVKRQKTNTPLQALVLLNDPTFVEAAKVIGEDIAKAPDLEQAIAETFRKLSGRKVKEEELALLMELQKKEYTILQQNPDKAEGWLSAGEYIIDPSLDPSLVASNAIVASLILNGDVSITKR